MAVEMKLHPIPLIVYAVYMRVFDHEVAMKHIANIRELCQRFGRHMIMVIGDFNMNSLRWMSDENEEYYLPMNVNTNMECFLKGMHELSFFQLSNIKNKFGNVLDLVFVNELGDVELAVDKLKIIGAIQQDAAHVPYEISLGYCEKRTLTNNVEKEIVCYKIGNYERVMEEFTRIDFTSVFNERDVDSAFDFFYSTNWSETMYRRKLW